MQAMQILDSIPNAQQKPGFCPQKLEMSKRKSPALEKSFELAVEIVKLSKLLNNRGSYELAHQLVRSGTSIGANLREAQSPESRADFIHKLKIAIKEAEETRFWLELVKRTEDIDIEEMSKTNSELLKIINKSISTAKQNADRQR